MFDLCHLCLVCVWCDLMRQYCTRPKHAEKNARTQRMLKSHKARTTKISPPVLCILGRLNIRTRRYQRVLLQIHSPEPELMICALHYMCIPTIQHAHIGKSFDRVKLESIALHNSHPVWCCAASILQTLCPVLELDRRAARKRPRAVTAGKLGNTHTDTEFVPQICSSVAAVAS